MSRATALQTRAGASLYAEEVRFFLPGEFFGVWANLSGGWLGAHRWLDASGVAHLGGVITRPGFAALNEAVLQLPEKYWPRHQIILMSAHWNSFALPMYIDSAGVLRLARAAGAGAVGIEMSWRTDTRFR